MSSVNRAFILGRLGKDPVSRQVNDTSVCNFSLATSDAKDATTWHDIVAWGKTAELCQKYLAKGSQAHVEGRIQHREYEAKDGTKRKVTEIVADRVTFVGSKRETAPAAVTDDNVGEEASLDSIPF